MKNFVALDMETATADRASICEIGLVVVRGGSIVDSKTWIVQPPNNEYDAVNSSVHGMTAEDTAGAPSLPDIWAELCGAYLDGNVVVCHNRSFDINALGQAAVAMGLCSPDIMTLCTLELSKIVLPELENHRLDTVYEYLTGKEFKNHHRAVYDAEGCAEIFMALNNCFGGGDDEARWITLLENHLALFRRPVRKKPKKRRSLPAGYNCRAKDIATASAIVDGPLSGKSVCLTGTLATMDRKTAYEKIAALGGIPVDGVTRKTDILVVGTQDLNVVGASGLSCKHKKAIHLIEQGYGITIIDGPHFIEQYNVPLPDD